VYARNGEVKLYAVTICLCHVNNSRTTSPLLFKVASVNGCRAISAVYKTTVGLDKQSELRRLTESAVCSGIRLNLPIPAVQQVARSRKSKEIV